MKASLRCSALTILSVFLSSVYSLASSVPDMRATPDVDVQGIQRFSRTPIRYYEIVYHPGHSIMSGPTALTLNTR